MAHWEPVLLANVDRPNSEKIDTYLKYGGYQALKKVLSMSPESIIAEVKNSGLRGRGGAGFPTGVKWGFMPKERAGQIFGRKHRRGRAGNLQGSAHR